MSSSTATPDMAMKPMAAEIENGMSRSHSANDAADPGERHAREDAQSVHDVVDRSGTAARRSGRSASGTTISSRCAGAVAVLELPAPFEVVAARRQRHLFARSSAGPRPRSCPGRGRARCTVTVMRRWPHSRVIVDGPSTTSTVARRDSGMRSPDGRRQPSSVPIGFRAVPRLLRQTHRPAESGTAPPPPRPTACCRSTRPGRAPPGPARRSGRSRPA